MANEFVGAASALDQVGLDATGETLGVGVAEIATVLKVETCGCGFWPDRRPVILFERHYFSRLTAKKFDASNPDISNPSAGRYGAAGAHQYDKLAQAIALDRKAALQSASWGIGQVMGANFAAAGFSDVEHMVGQMVGSENAQLAGMANFIKNNNLLVALQKHDWAAFAKRYNGANYAINHYDTKLAAAYQQYSTGKLPDWVVRAAQLYLTFLGYKPGIVDGLMGRKTRIALNKYQTTRGLAVTTTIDQEIVNTLKADVDKLN